jgi:hypothetical protein
MRLNLKLLENFNLIKDQLAQSMIIFDIFIADYGNLKKFGSK